MTNPTIELLALCAETLHETRGKFQDDDERLSLVWNALDELVRDARKQLRARLDAERKAKAWLEAATQQIQKDGGTL